MMRSCCNQIAETSAQGLHCDLNITSQTHPQCFNAEKINNGDKFEQVDSVQCIVFFNFSKAQYTLEKNKDLEKVYSKRNLKQMKKLDSFCKKLSVNQVNFLG